LDRMREAVLTWYQTIVLAYSYQKDTEMMYERLEKVVNLYLTPEEAKLAEPILQLNYTFLR
jgi:hypothetical protein